MGVARLSLAFIFALVLVFSLAVFFEPAEAKKSAGTPLTEIGSKKVCGDKLCAAPQSIEEKIAAFLESQGIHEGSVEEQVGRFSEGGVSQQAFDLFDSDAWQVIDFIENTSYHDPILQATFTLLHKNPEFTVLEYHAKSLSEIKSFDHQSALFRTQSGIATTSTASAEPEVVGT